MRKIIGIGLCCGMAVWGWLSVGYGAPERSPAPLTIHPAALQMIVGWISDTEAPVVTELNLEAVDKNRNQFDPERVTVDGDWRRCPNGEGAGFVRYRVREQQGPEYSLEYQENGGGTLTTSAQIRVIVEQRSIRHNGQDRLTRVLRVVAFDAR